MLVVEHDQVPVRDVEPGEMVHGLFRVVDVLVDDEGRAFRVLVASDSYLANRAVLAEDVVHLLARYVEGEVPDVEHAVYFRWEPRVLLAQTDRRHSSASPASPCRRRFVITVAQINLLSGK